MAKKKKVGAVPGEVVFTGRKKTDKVYVHYMEYDDAVLSEETLTNRTIKDFHKPIDQKVQWYDIRGLHDTQLLEEIGQTFNLHPLIVEDIADVNHRAKVEEYSNGIFFKLNALYVNTKKNEHHLKESISIFFGKQFVLSFQERKHDLFLPVRERLIHAKGRIRGREADYLAYALVDLVIDHYYEVLDNLGERVDDIENNISTDPQETIKYQIHKIKREILAVRKTVYPVRESINQIIKSESGIINERTKLFYRDIYDHTIETMDMIESQRDMIYGLQDLYISEISFKMNKVMQILTIVTTMFVPLTFLVGVYGMNFSHLPELGFYYGYYILWGVMILISIALLIFFKRKRWM